jgi:hypothetical protein
LIRPCTINHTRGEQVNHYTTDAVNILKFDICKTKTKQKCKWKVKLITSDNGSWTRNTLFENVTSWIFFHNRTANIYYYINSYSTKVKSNKTKKTKKLI